MPPKPRGRPPKKCRNLAGFPKASPISQACQTITVTVSDLDGIDDVAHCHVPIARSQGTGQLPGHYKKDQASSETEDSGEESDVEDYGECGWDELDDEDFAIKLAEMVMKDDEKDLDWLPTELRAKQAKKMGKELY